MAKSQSPIHLVLTGGTIDSRYDGTSDTVIPLEDSVIADFLDSLKLGRKIKATQICMKDSRDLVVTDRKKILSAIERSSVKKILITHGTYTMGDTARYLKANLKSKDKIVVLTGSIIPLSGFAPSDAPFNLGYSIASLDMLQNGVYVIMNGRVFTPEEVMKELKSGSFNSIFQK